MADSNAQSRHSHTTFVTNPDHDINACIIANQHHDVWGVSQPTCALLKGSAEHVQPPGHVLNGRLLMYYA